jgi:hypothetical protein
MSNPGPGQKPDERRHHRRYRIAGPVKFLQSGSEVSVEGLTQEISEGGLSAFLRPPGLTVGDTVEVELMLPGGALQARAQVRNHTNTHFRFQFIDLTPEQIQRIKDGEKELDPFRSGVMISGPPRPRS